MPVLGGTTVEVVERALAPAQERVALAVALELELGVPHDRAARVANSSTCTEWSMTSSTAASGLIRPGSPPRSRIASRIAARSTTAGTPVKSWRRTRPGREGDLREGSSVATQPGDGLDVGVRDAHAVLVRRTFSSRMRSVYGRRATSCAPAARRAGRSRARVPPTLSVERAPKLFGCAMSLDSSMTVSQGPRSGGKYGDANPEALADATRPTNVNVAAAVAARKTASLRVRRGDSIP